MVFYQEEVSDFSIRLCVAFPEVAYVSCDFGVFAIFQILCVDVRICHIHALTACSSGIRGTIPPFSVSKGHTRQPSAVIKGILTNGRHATRNRDVVEPAAPIKGKLPDRGNGIRNGNGSDLTAVIKRTTANFGDTLTKDHVFQLYAVQKCADSDLATFNRDRGERFTEIERLSAHCHDSTVTCDGGKIATLLKRLDTDLSIPIYRYSREQRTNAKRPYSKDSVSL